MRRIVVAATVIGGALGALATAPADAAPPVCAPGGEPVRFSGTASPDQERTYLDLPFEVTAGTTRVELAYSWTDRQPAPPSTPVSSTTFDLGLWDGDGLGDPDGFRGWSGSRAGRPGQPPVYVQPDVAARGYRPGAIEPGTWHADLGIAALNVGGADWTVTATCSAPPVGPAFVPDPVDPAHVADPAPGWYAGDFHMHGYHSNASAPTAQEEVDRARAEGLDFLPITEYVTGQHWDELGAVQRANPDVVIWPGREIITYFGHANAIGETRHVLDHRHGAPGVTLADIQAATLADGALFQVNHPTTFPGPVFSDFCRGCAFSLGDQIDWDRVDQLEVLTGPILTSSAELGLPGLPVLIENPFTTLALDLWQRLLREGHRITAVSGSDSKGVEGDAERVGWGSSATEVYATSLSRAALQEGVRAGHAYIRTQGADEGPTLSFTAAAPGGATAMFGDTLVADAATFTVRVVGGRGQVLEPTRDGRGFGAPVPVTSDDFTHTFTGRRDPGSGPLGTFFRVDTRALATDGAPTFRTTIGNPIFLAATGPSAPSGPAGPAALPTTTLARAGGAVAAGGRSGAGLAATGPSSAAGWAAGAVLAVGLVVGRRRLR